MNHWAVQYIGDEWIAGEHDCWAFFARVQRERFGREVPPMQVDATDVLAVARAIRDDDERSHWQPVDEPREGDAVLLAHARYPSHVGVWVETPQGAGVLHCVRGAGVVFSTPQALARDGWRRVDCYRRTA